MNVSTFTQKILVSVFEQCPLQFVTQCQYQVWELGAWEIGLSTWPLPGFDHLRKCKSRTGGIFEINDRGQVDTIIGNYLVGPVWVCIVMYDYKMHLSFQSQV